MVNPKPLLDEDGEVRALTQEEIRNMKPASEALPESLQRKLGVRSSSEAPAKEHITMQLSAEVLAAFRATGEGWQARIDAALADWLQAHSPEDVEKHDDG